MAHPTPFKEYFVKPLRQFFHACQTSPSVPFPFLAHLPPGRGTCFGQMCALGRSVCACKPRMWQHVFFCLENTRRFDLPHLYTCVGFVKHFHRSEQPPPMVVGACLPIADTWFLTRFITHCNVLASGFWEAGTASYFVFLGCCFLTVAQADYWRLISSLFNVQT